MLDNNTLQKAIAFLSSGNPRKCQDLLERHLDVLRDDEEADTLAPDAAKTVALALDTLCKAYFALHNPSKGVEILRQGVNFLQHYLNKAPDNAKSALQSLNALLAGLWQNLSFAALELKLYEESRNACAEALKIAKAVFTDNSPKLASVYFTSSALYYRLRQWDAAEALTLQAKEIWEHSPVPNPEKAATCMNNLGRIYEERGQIEIGIAWHRKAVAARRNLPNREDLAFSLGNLGVALAENGQWREAGKNLTEAVATYETVGKRKCRECRGFAANLDICRQAISTEK